ncbi:MAG TPA: hypothetical protein VN668_09840 [Stellaceae bacterium]|nr:hypothetical protein [Stellaceae bacterium]
MSQRHFFPPPTKFGRAPVQPKAAARTGTGANAAPSVTADSFNGGKPPLTPAAPPRPGMQFPKTGGAPVPTASDMGHRSRGDAPKFPPARPSPTSPAPARPVATPSVVLQAMKRKASDAAPGPPGTGKVAKTDSKNDAASSARPASPALFRLKPRNKHKWTSYDFDAQPRPPTARRKALDNKNKGLASTETKADPADAKDVKDAVPAGSSLAERYAGRNAPAGVFLMYGLRKEVNWAKTDQTHGMNGDAYVYSQAKGDECKDDKNNNRKLYRCVVCDGYYPRKQDKIAGETDDATITCDHIPPFSVRLGKRTFELHVCDGSNVWRGQVRKLAVDSFNDPNELRMMCQSCNSALGGEKDYDRVSPKKAGTHAQLCDGGDHSGLYCVDIPGLKLL